MRFACSFTWQQRFGDWKRKYLKTGFKVQVFENATVIVSVWTPNMGIFENGYVMRVRSTC